ncbi:MAG: SH3 domain-containing protein, partial [Clostridia bacterium]
DPAEIPQEDGTACKGTVKLVNASATLAIRTSRATDASIVGTAGNGAMVNVLTNDGTWCFIQYGSLKGYVPTNALRITGTPNGQEDAPSVISGFATVTANDYVNLRSAGSMDASVLSTAPKGAILTVFSVSGAWAHVQYCATTAYVHTNFLSISSSYPSGVVSSGSATATVSAEEGINEVSLRASASTNAAVILSIPVGAEVSVSSDDGSWSVVVYQGTNGYLLSANLSYSGESLDPNQPNEGGGTDGGGTDGGGTEPPAPGTETKAIVTTESGSLNMRAEPKAGSLVVTTIPRGTEVLVTSIGEAWCGVRYNGYTGYVMASFLTYSGDTITPPTTPPDLPQGENIAHVTTQSGSLNLRAEPRAGSQILRTIPRNATVTVLARGAEWCGVSYENNVGYVMSAFLTFDATNGEGESPGEGDSSTEPGQPTDPPTGNDPDEPITPDTGGENTLYATVTTVSGALNLRISPMPGSDVLARIPKGTTVVIDEKLAAWSKTSYAGQTGYVMNTFLTFRQGKPEESVGGDTAVVTTVSGSLNLRAEPSANAGLLMRIPQHATVSVQQRGDSWCYIGYGGTYGYAMTRFLTFSSMSADFAVPLPDDAAKNADDGTEEPGGTADTPADPTSAPSEPPAVETAYVHTESGLLNLRAEPQENGQLLTTIPQNAAVTLLAYGESWCEVRYDAHTGYAMTRFLRFEAPAITEPPTQESDETEQAETDPAAAWVLTSSGSLNLRQSPDGNAQVLANIPRLAPVLLFSESNGWSYLQYQGTSGYVMSKFLTRENPNSTQTPSGSNGEQGDEKPPMPAKPDNGTQGDVSEESGITLDVTLRAPDQATFALAKPADVQTEQPIWPECAERGEALARVPRGEKVEIILIGDFWCLIQYQDVQAYCLRDALSVISE